MDSPLPPPPGIDEPGIVLLRGAPPAEHDPVLDHAPGASGPAAARRTASGASTADDDDDDDPPPPPPLQKRRTSSFEYHEDGPSQYDVLELSAKGSAPLSPLFLDLIRAKIREAERQLHFAILSSRANDRHDAAKRCACALSELDYVRERVVLPPPVRLLDARILRTTSASLLSDPGEDRLLAVRKAEHLIQRAFQVLGELVDWDTVKKRGAAVEKLEEFLPMCYFNDSKAPGDSAGDSGALPVDYTETMVLWYQMMIHHGIVTLSKAKWKEEDANKGVKVENYAKAYKLFAVALEGFSETYEDETDAEYVSYTRTANGGMAKVAAAAVDNWNQDELLEIIGAAPKIDIENLKILIVKARIRKDDKRRQDEERLKKIPELDLKLRIGDDNGDGAAATDKGKGKAKADEDVGLSMLSPISPRPISARDKGKGKAILDDDDDKERELPAYSPLQPIHGKDEGEDWVMVEPKD